MRNIAVLLTFALSIAAWEAEARADRIQLPCDADMSVAVGTGIFTGHTDTESYGDIGFQRIQPTYLHFELSPFNNCETYSAQDDPKAERLSPHNRVTRWWLGRLNLYGSITPETTDLSFRNTPGPLLDKDGNPVLDGNGNPRTENTLTKADLEAGANFSWGAGARLSLFDGSHIHVEAFAEAAGTFGWNGARADTVVAHALELDLYVTKLVQSEASIRYRWSMQNVGVTIGVPISPNTLSKNRLTPFVSAGYTRFSADVDLSLSKSISDELTALGVDVAKVTERRTLAKGSITGRVGARLDFNDRFSLETSAMFAKTDYTTVYWFTGSATLRFDFPWRR